MSERANNPIIRFIVHQVHAGSWIAIIVYFAAVFAFLKNRMAVFGFPLDDAWIHRVYSHSFAFLQAFAYNSGQQEAGSTSPLWAIVSSPAHWFEKFGTDYTVLVVKVIGVLLGLVCILITQRIALRLTGSRLAAGIAGSLFALDPRLLFSVLSGMETPLLVALLLGACLALINKRFFLFLFLMGLAPVARPEAIVLLPFTFMGIRSIWQSKRHAWIKTVACLIPVAPTAIWVAFCLHTTGHVFPNTFYMKAQSFSLSFPKPQIGLQAVAQSGLVLPWLLAAGICAFCLFCLIRGGASALLSFVFLVIGPLTYLLAVLGSRDIFLGGYYWTRWVDPASHIITAAFCIGYGILLSIALQGTKNPSGKVVSGRRSLIQILISSAALVLLLMSVPTFLDSFKDRRNHLASDSRAIDIINVQMGKWIGQNTPPDAVVAVNDAGAIRYFGRRHTVDLLGLNNAEIAFGKVTVQEAIDKADWLAIFPMWFAQRGLLGHILNAFEARFAVTIPLEEYTICYSPSQTQKVAFKKKAPTTRANVHDDRNR